MADVYQWRRTLHIPFIIILQILFIILFAIFVRYDPQEALGSSEDPPLLNVSDSHSIDPQTTPKSYDSISSDNSESSKESEKIISEHDSAYEFEKHLVEVIQEIKEPNNPRNARNTAHEKIQSLESAMVKFIKDSQKSAP